MKVYPDKPFQLIYTVFQHEYLGYMIESYVVQLNEKGALTLYHQNISSKNAHEFANGLDSVDYQLIELTDSMQQDAVVNHFNKKKLPLAEFFLKTYDKHKGNEDLQEEIYNYVERRRRKILELIAEKPLFEMSNDGEPTGKKLEYCHEKASVLFHVMRNETNTHYFPTIKLNQQKLDFQYNGSYILCSEPAWMVCGNKLFTFTHEVDGKKLKPFLQKKFIEIPKKIEDTYFRKFVAPLVASFDVHGKGITIHQEWLMPTAVIYLSQLAEINYSLFDESPSENDNDSKILFDLNFKYGEHLIKTETFKDAQVVVEKKDDEYIFHKIIKQKDREKEILSLLNNWGLDFRNLKATLPKGSAFDWIQNHYDDFKSLGIELLQKPSQGKPFFLGKSNIEVTITDKIDWFDLQAIIRFDDWEIDFVTFRKLILKGKREIDLPTGEIAVIPDSWIEQYSELFAFAEDTEEGMKLKKHHVALVQSLAEQSFAKVSIDKKLAGLKHFSSIENTELPKSFKGTLRPYQQAGYNWMVFLESYNLGGCLADDMGLGKTIQTLALLQKSHEDKTAASMIVMPTSLLYNWMLEAQKFTPNLKVLLYTGPHRQKLLEEFEKYDLILTSYGVVRIDIDRLKNYYFNYLILDESQVIKNPDSQIAKTVKELSGKYRLILTGTPIENNTMDLWSQMQFVNPGLLGTPTFFKKEFLNPIEKRNDDKKIKKLFSIIKPFILRRLKSQVAEDLPGKMESIKYCDMTPEQEEFYEKEKNQVRSQLVAALEKNGLAKSNLLILEGLSRLRQIANHPKMVSPDSTIDSGKMRDIMHMLKSIVQENHHVLIFSQYVKHLTLVAEALQKEQIEFAYLDGSTRDRQSQIKLFQEDEDVHVFLISLKAGGVGLNLTKADYVFILDPWWNPAAEAQAIDRAHRIGQENHVFVYRFITRNTVEEKIIQLQEKKRKLASELIIAEEGFMKNLQSADIIQLLE